MLSDPNGFGMCPFEPYIHICLISAHDPRHHSASVFALIAVCNISLDHYWSTLTFAQSATPRLLLYCRSRGTPIAAKHLHLNHAKLRVAATIPSPSPLLFPQPHSAFKEAHTTNTTTYMFTHIQYVYIPGSERHYCSVLLIMSPQIKMLSHTFGRTPTCLVYNTRRFAYSWRACLLYTSPSPRDLSTSRMPSSA